MKKSMQTKQRILTAAADLIQQSAGDISTITARDIAQQSRVGLGLINYYFTSKENLVTLAVQSIIDGVIHAYIPKETADTDHERFYASALGVFNFLFEHPALARISILNDLQSYSSDSNTIKTQNGFSRSLTTYDAPTQAYLSFLVTSILQAAFLGQKTLNSQLGYDFTSEQQRSLFVRRLVNTLLPQGADND